MKHLFLNIKISSNLFLLFCITNLFFSCGSVKHSDLLMFSDVQNEIINLSDFPIIEIQIDDILGIEVTSRNPENVIAFQQKSPDNRQSIGSVGERAIGTLGGYRVDEEGNIYLPFLGSVKATGKTMFALRNEITENLKSFIPDATVQVRFLNFRVTLLGELNRPNTYTIPNQRLTILEAIGMAGDFTSYARRNSILLIRERNNKREQVRIDIQDKEIFTSPYFYLSPNDIIYVEPLKAKQYATRGDFAERYSGIWVPVVSLITFIVGGLVFN